MIRREPAANAARSPKRCDAKSLVNVSEFKIHLARQPKRRWWPWLASSAATMQRLRDPHWDTTQTRVDDANVSLGFGNKPTFPTLIRHVPFRPEPDLTTRLVECPFHAKSERWLFDVAASKKSNVAQRSGLDRGRGPVLPLRVHRRRSSWKRS